MALSKKQKEDNAKVTQRLTTEVPLRLDAVATASGRSESEKAGGSVKGSTKSVHGMHPSLEGAVGFLAENGLRNGTITTSSGLQVQVSSHPRSPEYKPTGQGISEQKKGAPPLPPIHEGVSQKYVTQIGRDHGPEKAAQFTAEAEKIAQRPNPLRSDGAVDAVMTLRSPSMGGNQRTPGNASALAKMEDAYRPSSKVSIPKSDGSNFPSASQEPYATGPRDLALKSIGYSDTVQNKMLGVARDRVARRQGTPGYASLSPVEVESRAQGQVQEHLDEALHGTRSVGHEDALIRDAVSSEGMGIETPASGGTARLPATKTKGGGLGMTPSRSPESRAQRAVIHDLGMVTKGGKWNVRNVADVLTAAKNDLDLVTAKQKARQAAGRAPEKFNTMSPGANVSQKARRETPPAFSTNNPGVSLPPSYGPDTMSGDQSKITREKNPPLPPAVRPGGMSPVPPNLPSGPAKIGRSREERGVKPSTFPTGSEPVKAGKPGTVPPKKKAAPAGGGGGLDKGGVKWMPSQGLAEQTAMPKPFEGTGIKEGMAAARSQNVQLGQRQPTGSRQAFKTVP